MKRAKSVIFLGLGYVYAVRCSVDSRDETLKQMWPDGAKCITQVTKRPVSAGIDFKNSIIALVEKNLSRKVNTNNQDDFLVHVHRIFAK